MRDLRLAPATVADPGRRQGVGQGLGRLARVGDDRAAGAIVAFDLFGIDIDPDQRRRQRHRPILGLRAAEFGAEDERRVGLAQHGIDRVVLSQRLPRA